MVILTPVHCLFSMYLDSQPGLDDSDPQLLLDQDVHHHCLDVVGVHDHRFLTAPSQLVDQVIEDAGRQNKLLFVVFLEIVFFDYFVKIIFIGFNLVEAIFAYFELSWLWLIGRFVVNGI